MKGKQVWLCLPFPLNSGVLPTCQESEGTGRVALQQMGLILPAAVVSATNHRKLPYADSDPWSIRLTAAFYRGYPWGYHQTDSSILQKLSRESIHDIIARKTCFSPFCLCKNIVTSTQECACFFVAKNKTKHVQQSTICQPIAFKPNFHLVINMVVYVKICSLCALGEPTGIFDFPPWNCKALCDIHMLMLVLSVLKNVCHVVWRSYVLKNPVSKPFYLIN